MSTDDIRMDTGDGTLRDYFAAAAVTACVAQVTDPAPKCSAEELARFAYDVAEAMLRERERRAT
jgi:hypothetical protein